MFQTHLFLYLTTILPPIFLGFLVWKSDRFTEPVKFLIASVLLGVSIILHLDFFIFGRGSYSTTWTRYGCLQKF